jgi:medium-chain acyl-[acyl-carrier-protein] hydrolase
VLVPALADALRDYLDLPFAFFGHSMGALIAFELARTLRRQEGITPVRLFVSGHSAPHLPIREPILHRLPLPEFIEQLRQMNGTSEDVLRDAGLLQLLMPMLRADLELCETYVYTDDMPLDCPISAFGGSQDPGVTYDDLAAWKSHTSSTFTLRMVPGHHFFLEQNLQVVLSAVEEDVS